MLSPTIIRVAATAALGLHALAHANALIALVRQLTGEGLPLPARVWALPDLDPTAAAAVGVPLWLIATAAFALAALSPWVVNLPVLAWRPVAMGGAATSLLGIGLFFGTWPGAPDTFYSILDMAVGLAVNVAIAGLLLRPHAPRHPVVGR